MKLIRKEDGNYSISEPEDKYGLAKRVVKLANEKIVKINKTIDWIAEEEADKNEPDMYSMCYLQGKVEGISDAIKPLLHALEDLLSRLKEDK